MPITRETIVAALHAQFSGLPSKALRGKVLPEGIFTAGLLNLSASDPGEPEVMLSPPISQYQHQAEIKAVV